MKNKKAAMEMSVGTIVTIVLLMSVLVLGIFLVQRIFESARGAIDLTDQELQSEIGKLFDSGDESPLVIYPASRFIQVKQEDSDAIGIGIKNLVQGEAGQRTFSYKVVARSTGNCGITESELESYIVTGKEENNIPVPSGDSYVTRVRFNIPRGSPLCTASYRVELYKDSTILKTDSFDIEIKAK